MICTLKQLEPSKHYAFLQEYRGPPTKKLPNFMSMKLDILDFSLNLELIYMMSKREGL